VSFAALVSAAMSRLLPCSGSRLSCLSTSATIRSGSALLCGPAVAGTNFSLQGSRSAAFITSAQPRKVDSPMSNNDSEPLAKKPKLQRPKAPGECVCRRFARAAAPACAACAEGVLAFGRLHPRPPHHHLRPIHNAGSPPAPMRKASSSAAQNGSPRAASPKKRAPAAPQTPAAADQPPPSSAEDEARKAQARKEQAETFGKKKKQTDPVSSTVDVYRCLCA